MREMPRKLPRALLLAVPLAWFLYFYDLSAAGILGPDEPRYASIAREMARSGDWVTPRLWGLPWFEKPVLLYWMSGAAFRLGLGDDLAPRVPVALTAVAFLAFYWWILKREFGCRAAWLAVVILGTSAAWLGFSQVGVTDLPLTAAFSAAMLLALPWIARGDARFLPAAAALLGVAVLAKSLVPLVLSLPLACWWIVRRKQIGAGQGTVGFLRLAVPFLVVALPWHALCYLRNGRIFPETLFVQHQFGRFVSGALQHVEPWWFYIPIVAGLLLPWSPLFLLLFRRGAWGDPRRRFLLAWFAFGLVFFSAATNKLPGYVLPLLPAAAALMAARLDEVADARGWLAACALLLAVFPIAAPVVPEAVANGLSRAALPQFNWTWLPPLGLAAGAWLLEGRSRRLAAALSVALGAGAGIVYVKRTATPELDRLASARALWRTVAPRAAEVCVNGLKRDIRYSLNYYSVVPLPECSAQPRPLRIIQPQGRPPELSARLDAPPRRFAVREKRRPCPAMGGRPATSPPAFG